MTTLSLPSRPQNLELQVDSGDAFDVREFAVEEGVRLREAGVAVR